MSDYGFRIAVVGQDVKTCSDLNTIVNSKYSNLKGALSGSGVITMSQNVVVTITITHNLGYTPFVTCYVDEGQISKYSIVPMYLYSYIAQSSYWIKADATYIYIKAWQGNDYGDTVLTNYKYFIFLDKGKL